MSKPAKVNEVVGQVGVARMIPCPGCESLLEQRMWSGRWTPEKCLSCLRQDGTARITESRAEQEATAAHLRLAALGVPKLYRDVDFENFRFHGTPKDREVQDRVVRRGRLYCSDWPNVPDDAMLLALRGAPGTGKGHWVWSVARWITTHYQAQVRVIRLADLIREIRATWRQKAGPGEEEVLARYRSYDLLAIDEVSRHAFYGQTTQHLFDVVNDRIENCRPTLLTSNETPEGLEDILGPALTDRVNGCGALLDFGAASWRSRDREAA